MRVLIGTVAAVVAVPAIAFAALRPQFEDEWALYTAPTAHGHYQLYIDPFPSARSCELDRRVVRRNGEFGRCERYVVLSFDRKAREQLFWEFESPGNPFARLCGKLAKR